MTLIEQCQIWHENDEFQRIADAIEALPASERTPELICELARAYNNIATAEDYKTLEKAAELLLSVEEELGDTYIWNYRLGYSYYYLDRQSDAITRLNRALELKPEDEAAEELLSLSRKELSLPLLIRPFRKRVRQCWEAFEAVEAELRGILKSEHHDPERMNEALRLCSDTLSIAFHEIAFELGFGATHCELILSAEGDRTKLPRLVYFAEQVPAALSEHWQIIVGRPRSVFGQQEIRFDLSAGAASIGPDDIEVLYELTKSEDSGSHSLSLTMYSEKLIPLLTKNEGQAWWMVAALTDHMLGEISAIYYIKGLDIRVEPLGESAVPLSELPERLIAEGIDLDVTAEHYLEHSYLVYRLNEETKDSEPRMDIISGRTRAPQLIDDYLGGQTRWIDDLHRDGAIAGFIYYPLEPFRSYEEYSQTVLQFREELEMTILEETGDNVATFIGGATGTEFGYIDFVAWDLGAFLDAAANALLRTPLPWAIFQPLRRGAMGTTLINISENDATMKQ